MGWRLRLGGGLSLGLRFGVGADIDVWARATFEIGAQVGVEVGVQVCILVLTPTERH